MREAISIAGDLPVVNGRHLHCSKRNVARHFEQVFGYALQVDPHTYAGPMVRKSDENAAHDGVTVMGPLPADEVALPGQVYQRLVDNSAGPSVVDIRVSVVRTVQDHSYVKLRPVLDRYSNVNSAAWFAPTSVLLTPDEIAHIDVFCASIGLDFGQLDLCRDNTSGRVYVVDANNTPFGPANGMSPADAAAAVTALGADFAREFGLLPVA